MKGKLIIIEGIDGSGKSTQVKLMIKKLKTDGKQVRSIHFPQHGQDVFGNLVDAYLQGEFGPAPKVDYRLASTLYALDRFEAKNKINQWLKSGYWVVLDRYAESNFGHQGGKISSSNKRREVIKWLYDLDYKVLGNPKPDLVLFLNVPVKFVTKLMKNMGKIQDGHESDKKFLANSRQAYLEACGMFKYWKNIDCVENGKLLAIDEISARVEKFVKNK